MTLDRLPSTDLSRAICHSDRFEQMSTIGIKYYRARANADQSSLNTATYLAMTRDTLCNEYRSTFGRYDINIILYADQFENSDRFNRDRHSYYLNTN